MRWVSVQATSIAALLVLGVGTPLRAQSNNGPADNFFADVENVDAPGATAPPRVVGAEADRLPTGSVKPRAVSPPDPLAMDALLSDAPHAPAVQLDKPGSTFDLKAGTKADSKPEPVKKAAEKTVDPEPDVAVKPPIGASTQDPLDALTPDVAKPVVAKPGAIKAETPKTEPSKPDSGTAPVQPDVLPAVDAAIKGALDKRDGQEIRGAAAAERRKERAAVAFLYASHGFAPIWSDKAGPVAAVPSVLERLAQASDDALSLSDVPKTLVATGAPEAIASSDIALTEAVVAYARQASGSRVDPAAISPLIGVKRTLADPAEVVDAIVAAGLSAGDKLQAVNPIDRRYVALREQLVSLHAAHVPKASTPIPPGPTLRVGMSDKRVPLLRARFGIGSTADMLYDVEVAAAVEEFQRENALPPSGTLTRRTVEAMSGGRAPRTEGTIAANMEMWRWMPRDLGADRIEVNVPDFIVTVFRDGMPVSKNRVVVGKLDTPTPLFSNTMKYLIVNPYWNVPQSIIKNELLPKGHGSLSYLDGRGYSVSSHDGFPVVKQLPGDKNALGRIKFLFPNDYSVYLHDTPSKALFSSAKRAFSHGCVRVDKPFAFAESVLNDAPAASGKGWSQERLQDMIGDKERYVNLPAPLPIHIEYFTASVEDGGTVKVRDDVYGYANAVAAALGQESATVPVAGRTKPKPVVYEAARRQPEKTAAVTPASRSFWDLFRPALRSFQRASARLVAYLQRANKMRLWREN